MGAFDDLEARSSNRYSGMLGRTMGEARRRIVLLTFLVIFLLLTVLAFRRQDTIKEAVNSRLHHGTSTTTPVTKPDVTLQSKPDVKTEAQPSTKPDVKPITKPDTTKADSKPDAQPTSKTETKPDTKSEKPSIFKGKSGSKNLKLGNGDRTLADSTVADIHNTTLGVRSAEDESSETLADIKCAV